MTGIFALVVAALMALLLTSRRLWGGVLSPVVLFGLCWLIPSAIVASGLIAYYPVSALGWFLILGSYVGFALGSLVQRGLQHPAALAEDEREYLSRLRRRFSPSALSAVLVVYVAISLLGAHLLGGRYLSMSVGYIAEHAMELKQEFYQSGIGLLYWCTSPSAVLLCFLFLTVPRRRLLVGTALLAMLLLPALTLQKKFLTETLFAVGLTYALVRYPRCRRPTRRIWGLVAILGLAATSAFGFFVAYTNFKSPYYGGDHRFMVRDGFVRVPWSLRYLGAPLWYLTGGYVAFDQYLQQGPIQEPQWGRESLNILYVVLRKLDPSTEVPVWREELIPTPMPINVTTYLGRVYRDFGVPGCMLLPFLMGFGFQWLYRRASLGDPLHLVLYAEACWVLLIAFFSFHLFYSGFWISMSYLGLAMILTRTRPRAAPVAALPSTTVEGPASPQSEPSGPRQTRP